jgi:transcriptional regulator with XRE-family HTH domain
MQIVSVSKKMDKPVTGDTLAITEDVCLGLRLKCVRESRGLSQRELAKRAGVPHSSISMIEQGLNSPSINSLAKILGGIPMSLAQFFSAQPITPNEQLVRAAIMCSSEVSPSKNIYVQAAPAFNRQSSVEFARNCFGPQSDTGECPHYALRDTKFFVASGSVELTINTFVTQLHTGDTFLLIARQPYRIKNLSTAEDCIIFSCTF